MALDLNQEDISRFVQAKNWKIHYYEAGEGHPLLMLHGSGPGATGWSNFGPNMRELATKYRCIAADMPGWGRSDAVTADERDHVEAAVQLLDALGIEKAAFIGNSMGGMTSIRFAMEHPDRISHLITMGSGGGSSIFAPAGRSEGIKVLQAAYHDPSPAGMRRLVNIMTFDPEFATDALVNQRSEAAMSRPDHLQNFIDGIPAGRRTMDLSPLAESTVPALLIHGRDDRVVHFENSLSLVAKIPNSRLVLLNRCGHWAQVEHPEEFNRLVDDFVSNN
ncbi:MAG: alpha/beta hydrolase [Arthrobacter sp.]